MDHDTVDKTLFRWYSSVLPRDSKQVIMQELNQQLQVTNITAVNDDGVDYKVNFNAKIGPFKGIICIIGTFLIICMRGKTTNLYLIIWLDKPVDPKIPTNCSGVKFCHSLNLPVEPITVYCTEIRVHLASHSFAEKPCDQVCTELATGYVCSCLPGYLPRPDNATPQVRAFLR